jgi:hypothetical protein
MYHSEVTQAQLGGIDDIFRGISNVAAKIAGTSAKVSAIAPQVSDVISGRKELAVIPKGESSFVLGGSHYGVPTWMPVALIGGLAWFAFKKR